MEHVGSWGWGWLYPGLTGKVNRVNRADLFQWITYQIWKLLCLCFFLTAWSMTHLFRLSSCVQLWAIEFSPFINDKLLFHWDQLPSNASWLSFGQYRMYVSNCAHMSVHSIKPCISIYIIICSPWYTPPLVTHFIIYYAVYWNIMHFSAPAISH